MTFNNEYLEKYLSEVSKLSRGNLHGIPHVYASFAEMVMKHGAYFQRKPFPDTVARVHRRGKPNACYTNAYTLAHASSLCYLSMDIGAVYYCEGFGLLDGCPWPIEHAWVVDGAGNCYDNTWDQNDQAIYFGVTLSLKFVEHQMLETGLFGALQPVSDSKRGKSNYSLFKDGLPAWAFQSVEKKQ